jgi:hypothetical protein
MESEGITIKTTREDFFREYLTLKRPIINVMLSKLNRKRTVINDIPLTVFSELLYINDKYRHLPDDERWAFIFSKQSRKNLAKKLNMPEHHLSNYLYQLRKIKIISGNRIHKAFIVYAEDQSLNFQFIINGQSLDEKINSSDSTQSQTQG